jgi:ribosomal protein S13
MAALNAMRTMLVRIGLSENAAQIIVAEQGLDSLEEIKLLTDDEIESLCKVVRRPGGTVPGPNPGDAPVNNPGVPVNLRAENHMKLLAFYLRHQDRVGRATAAADIQLDTIRTIRELRDFESTYKAPDDPPTINAKDWPKTMESIHEYLRSYLGDRKIPLAYVIRKDQAVPATDPGNGYATVQDEMIARAKHYTTNADGTKVDDPAYVTNREKVYEIIAKMTRDQTCWTYVKPAQKTRDGRMAYNGLFQHFLGPNNVDNMATMAEDKLKSTAYNGEQRRWDFERYVNVHKSQHSILEGLVEHGYSGIDPRSKVRFLLDGIKTDKFDSVKAQIMANAELRNDFDSCVTLYQDFIKQTTKSKPVSTVNISQVKTSAGKRKAEDVEDRYYTKAEYDALSNDAKKALAAKRSKRGHVPGSKSSKVHGKGKAKATKTNADVLKKLKAVERSVSQLSKKAEADDHSVASIGSSSYEGNSPTKVKKYGHPTKEQTTNRTNKALIRLKQKADSRK